MTFALIRNAVNFYLSLCKIALMLWRLNLCDGVHIGCATKVILHHTTLLACCCVHTYRSLKFLLQILTTGPVTTATNERSFSALRYLKAYLRITTKEARLNGLVLLFVHRDLNINFKHVIYEFSRNSRRLNFN